MTRRGRVLVAILAGLGLLAAAAAAFLWWAMTTPAGARWVLARAAERVPGSLRVESLEGTISGPLVIEGLNYRSESMHVAIDRLELDWRPRALLSRLLDIGRIDARGIRVVRSASGAEPASEGLPALHLPVNVVVRQASVSDVEIIGPEAGPPTRIERIELASRSQGGRVLVDRFSVRGPAVSLRAEGELSPSADYPLDVRFDWSATPAGAPRLAGKGSLSGSLEDLEVRHRLTAPFSASLEASIARPLRDPRVSGRLRADRIELREIDPDWPALVASVNLFAEGRLADLSVSGFVDAQRAGGVPERLRARLKIARQDDGVRIDELALTAPGLAGRVHVAGEVAALGSDPRFDLRARWEDVVATPEGTLTARGRLDDYALSIDAAVRAVNGVSGRLSLAARGDRTGARIETLALLALSGEVRGSGRVSWKPAVAWDLALSGEALDPGAAFPNWPGRIGFTAASAGTIEDGGPVGTVSLSRLDGRLRDEPLSGQAHVEIQPNRYEIRETEISLGSARLTASGEVAGGRSDLQWTLDVPKLGEVLPDAAGSLASRGRWSGGTDRPRLSAHVEGSDLRLRDLAAGNLRIEGHVDLGERMQSAVDLAADGVRSGGLAVERLRIHGEGTREAHTLSATASRGSEEVRLSVSGGLDGRTWRGEIRTLALRSRELGDWNLERRASVAVSAEAASLEGFCWSAAGGGSLCAGGAYRKTAESALEVRLERIPLSLARAFLPTGLTWTGTVGGDVRASIDAARNVQARAELALGAGRIAWNSGEGASIAVDGGSFQARVGRDGARAEASLRTGGRGSVQAQISLPGYSGAGMPGGGQPLQGRIQAGFPDVAVLGQFLPRIERPGGRLEADLEISGTVGDPRVAGLAALREASAEIPEYGLSLRHVEVAIHGEGDQLRVEGRAASGDGRLELRGTVPLAAALGAAETAGRFEISGESFLLSDTEEAVVRVSPDLTVEVAGRRVAVTGEVTVPRARVEYESRFARIPVSPDVVVVGGPGAPGEGDSAGAWAVTARVRVVLGRRVEFSGLGAEVRLTGSLLLEQAPGEPVRGTGSIDIVEGRYKKYGQDLEVEKGRITFAGPIRNPALDLKAFRTADDGVVAGIVVRGTLERPEVSVYSEPPMSETDALAYVVLGHKLDESSSSDTSLVASAASSLGVKGANLLTAQLARKAGLDVAKVETEGTFEEAALVVGKYLTPDLYFQYGIGIFHQESTIEIRYELSRRWAIRTVTSVRATGGDVLYTIEK